MRPDRVALEAGEQHSIRPFSVEHVEVVHPEIDEHLLELSIRVQGAKQLLLDQLGVDELLRLVRGHGFAPQFGHVCVCRRRKGANDLLAFLGIERIEQCQFLFRRPSSGRADLLGREQFVQRRPEASNLLLPLLLFHFPRAPCLFLEVVWQTVQHLWRHGDQDEPAGVRIQRGKDRPALVGRTIQQSAALLLRQ